MKEKELLEIVDKTDKVRESKFIIRHSIIQGLLLLFVLILLNVIIEKQNLWTYIHSEHFIRFFIFGLIFILSTGYLSALFQWKYYHKKKDKLLNNKL